MTYEYRIYPSEAQLQQIDEWLETCRKVYNYALAERRDRLRSRKCSINACSLKQEYIITPDTPKPTYASQCKSLSTAKQDYPDLKMPYSQVLQQTLSRLEKAFVGMWEQGRGFPRFKKPGRLRSFVYPQFRDCPAAGRTLKLPKLGNLEIRLHRPIPNGFKVKQVRILKRASGYYALLSLQADIEVPTIQPHGYPMGIDVGLNTFVATSEGELFSRPRFFVDAQRKLKSLNRDVSRKQKGSKNQCKARQKVARFYERIASRRKDFHRKTAHHLCEQAGMIFAEELNLKALAKGMLGKHCLDAGWGQFLTTLEWVAWKQGVFFFKVPAAESSQECPECATAVKKDLSIRVHHCPECGYETDRDVASGQVIRNRGLAAVGHIAKGARCGGSPRCGDSREACGAESVGVALKQENSGAIQGSPRYSACT